MITEIRPGLFWLCPPDGGNAFLLRTTKGLALFDTGLHKHRAAMLGAMRGAGLDPAAIRLAFVSHLHCDHVGSMGWWRRRFGFKVVAHAAAAGPIEAADLVATGSKIPYAQFDEEFVPCHVDRRVRGGEVLTLGDTRLVLISAPGHTPGSMHVAFDGVLVVGDTLFADGGIGWIDAHWGSNPEDYIETLRRMRAHLGALVLPGHGRPYRLGKKQIEHGIRIMSFYIPLSHGLGFPRAPSRYQKA